MTDEERIALMHAELDGDLTTQQRADLARLLLADPQLRASRDELRELCTRLDAVGQVEPPTHLKESILRRLPPGPPAASFGRATFGTWRLAAMIAGLLMAGAVIYETLQGPVPGSRETSGTMVAGTATVVDSVTLSGAVTGKATLYRDNSGLVLGLEVSAAEPVDVLIAAGSRAFRVNGLGAGIAAGGRRTLALPDLGVQRDDLELSFLTGGRTVAHATLRTAEH